MSGLSVGLASIVSRQKQALDTKTQVHVIVRFCIQEHLPRSHVGEQLASLSFIVVQQEPLACPLEEKEGGEEGEAPTQWWSCMRSLAQT